MRPPLGASLACHSPLCDPGWVPRLLRASLSPRNVFFHHAKQVMGTAQKGLVNCEGLSPCAVPGSGLEVGGVVGTGTWSLICFSSSFPPLRPGARRPLQLPASVWALSLSLESHGRDGTWDGMGMLSPVLLVAGVGLFAAP